MRLLKTQRLSSRLPNRDALSMVILTFTLSHSLAHFAFSEVHAPTWRLSARLHAEFHNFNVLHFVAVLVSTV